MDKIELEFRGSTRIDERLLFIAQKGIPCTIDLNNNDITLNAIPELLGMKLHVDFIKQSDHKIIFLSVDGTNLKIYDKNNYEISEIIINCNKNDDGNYALVELIYDTLYIFTRESQKLVIVNIKNNRIVELHYPDNIEEKYICGVVKNDEIILFPENGNRIISFDCKTMQFRVIEYIKQLRNVVHSICVDEKCIILESNGNVLCWNMLDNSINSYESAKKHFNMSKAAIRVGEYGDKIIILPYLASDIIVLNLEDDSIDVFTDYPKGFGYTNLDWAKYCHYYEEENYYYYSCRTSGYIMQIDKKKASVRWLDASVSKEKVGEFYLRINKSKHFGESDDVNLKSFLQYI